MKKCTVFLMIFLLLMTMVTPVFASKDDKILRVATAYDANSLDPVGTNDVASTNVMRQIYEPLIEIDHAGVVLEGKGLAESYEVEDNKTYRFTLKEGVLFHNGEEMKAEDVAFSLQRAAEAPSVQHIFGDIDIDSIKVLGDYEVELSLNEPNSTFLVSLFHSGGYIVNKKFVEEAGDDFGTTQVCGTGPFKMLSWNKNDRVILERFEDYHGEAPSLAGIEIIPMPEPSSRLISLEAGDVDVAYEIAAMDIDKVEENEELVMLRNFENTTQYLGFNVEVEPFDNKLVRQAFAYVIDMPRIVEAVYMGVGRAATGPIGPNIKYSIAGETEPHEINIEKAKELMKEAGYEDGLTVTLSTNEKRERVDMAQIIKEMLKEINVEVEINILEWSAYLDALGKGEVQMFEIGWTPAVPDPDMGLFAPLSTETIGEGANFSRFSNEKVDELLKKGRMIEDGEEREAIYKEIQEIHIEECPWIYQYNFEATIAVNKNVQNLEVTPFGYQNLFEVSFGDAE